jgi:hypothetical protein
MAARILLFIAMFYGSLHAGIVVVVSDRSPVHSMTRSEVRQLFLNNQNGQTFAVECVPNTLHEQFYSEIAGKTASQLRAYRARQIFSGRGKPPRHIKRDELATYLETHPDAVTYVEDDNLPSTFRVVYRLPQ